MNTTDRERMRRIVERMENGEEHPLDALENLSEIIREAIRTQKGMVLAYTEEILVKAVKSLREDIAERDQYDDGCQTYIEHLRAENSRIHAAQSETLEYLRAENMRVNAALNARNDYIDDLIQQNDDLKLRIENLRQMKEEDGEWIISLREECESLEEELSGMRHQESGYKSLIALLSDAFVSRSGGAQ